MYSPPHPMKASHAFILFPRLGEGNPQSIEFHERQWASSVYFANISERLLAGDQGAELPLDGADPCPDFLRILRAVDLKTVGLPFETDP